MPPGMQNQPVLDFQAKVAPNPIKKDKPISRSFERPAKLFKATKKAKIKMPIVVKEKNQSIKTSFLKLFFNKLFGQWPGRYVLKCHLQIFVCFCILLVHVVNLPQIK